ncbi:baseplate multidomain protein megatron [Shimia marina]|uniref:Host specificity protein n=1 Tax=Shimia marina TaxID=321267 RepID=A0A0P1ETA3_9RHOB|nr:glycoside hydrolase/phage tail family protein [Shimia marina]CUH53466.1 hypothetical protein SHM7688_02920 [Shimia marina]SFD76311.1 Putative phage tail protein [Shimia marina]
MATLILAAAGAAIGGSVGGGLVGVSAAAIGQLAGATLGRVIDQAVMGNGADVVETGKLDRFRITGSAEGAAQARVFGRVRAAGQVIWATRFQEQVSESGGGKGRPAQPKTRSYSYSVSLAIALCEGEITRVGRIWADGIEISGEEITMRVYTGRHDQMPDPKIEAVEGAGAVPAYRGTAYVVIEDLELAPFGNRVPQFSFEVIRATPEGQVEQTSDYGQTVRAAALMPGTGEYALATTPVYCEADQGEMRVANENTPAGVTDFSASMQALEEELPNCAATSLVVSWFGNDLRAGMCQLRPMVESTTVDGRDMPWQVSGLSRTQAQLVPFQEERPVYGGTPTDVSVVQALRDLRARGKAVTFYPFILMQQMAENGLPDPWSDAPDQPVLPWRGRITLSIAPGRDGTPDGSAQADTEVAAFFGTAQAADFEIGNGEVHYTGPQEWSYRRFILHYAALCMASGGVEAFCIGSEMRGLTQIRGADGFTAVAQLKALAAEVRNLMGPEVKIGYAADWSEYFGYHPQDGSGDVYFHLDPLWACDDIDFIGIDNYMPLSDWRDGADHLDAQHWSDGRAQGYLQANVAGGEGYEWYYASAADRVAQTRTPITDGAFGEAWVFRYKDIANWWAQPHHERIGGARQSEATNWVPKSKPIWFTEIGCAAIDKGGNQPNKFLDEKSSESAMPHFSNGLRDDAMQQAYYEAMYQFWSLPENNPQSDLYGGRMIDTGRMFAWAWDARPFPAFPNARDLWSDGGNYARGHWINGRVSNRSLASVVSEICRAAGVLSYDISGLYGVVRGYVQADVSDGRAALQPLMLRHGFDAVERDGTLKFVMRAGQAAVPLDSSQLAVSEDLKGDLERNRAPEAEVAGRVRLNFSLAERDFEAAAEEAILPGERTEAVAQSDSAEVLTRVEGRQTAERWLAEARVARDRIKFALPPSRLDIGAGEVIAITSDPAGEDLDTKYRLDRVTQQAVHLLEGGRVEAAIYAPSDLADEAPRGSGFVPAVPVQSLFLDLPLLRGDEAPHAPHIAVTARPWPGSVAIYDSDMDDGYQLNQLLEAPAHVGITQTPLMRGAVGRWDRGAPLTVRMLNGELHSVSQAEVLNGKNLLFIGDGTPDRWEAMQFRQADLIGTNHYQLSDRLRGQLGTAPLMPDVWPAGSWVVALTSALAQMPLSPLHRGTRRHYRIGPADKGYDAPSYTHHEQTFVGVGLRPFAPVHLRFERLEGGDLRFHWMRQTRVGGDSWEGFDVPLGEEREAYLIRLRRGAQIVREVQVDMAQWLYPSSEQQADGGNDNLTVEVAQISAVFGAGLTATLDL